jgi:hypothetical protein
VCFGSINSCYEKCDGRDFIVISLHQGSKFSKKKLKHFKILEGRPKVLLYTYPFFFSFFFLTFRVYFFIIGSLFNLLKDGDDPSIKISSKI